MMEDHVDALWTQVRPTLHLLVSFVSHTLVLREVNQSFHMCAQDVQITHKVNSSQCYNYIISGVYLLQNDP
jgi:hypothetical protein